MLHKGFKTFSEISSLNEGFNETNRELLQSFRETPEGRDLYAMGVSQRDDYSKVKYERRGYGQSMPRTAAYKTPEGKFRIEHYSSKPGLEVYGVKEFDTPQELLRHIWIRIAKNLIPASLISKREAEKRINLDVLFPIGSGVSQDQFLQTIKPLIGGEELVHPSNDDLLNTETIKKLINLGLAGVRNSSGGEVKKIVSDISKNEIIKYHFYCPAAQVVKKIYSPLIKEIIGDSPFRECIGSLVDRYAEYESWTVTNTNRLPRNSVNYRSGENTLRCNVQDNDMMAAVFLSIIKRTFKRSKTSSNLSERIIIPTFSKSNSIYFIIEELNSLMSDYFFEAASTLQPSVFFESKFHQEEDIVENAKALLVKYFMKKGSTELKDIINSKENLKDIVNYATSTEDIDSVTLKLIKAYKVLQFI